MTKVGTDLYAAPEHYSLLTATGNKLTPAADVYGFAKTLYFMFCGRPPYEFRQQQITHLPAIINTESWAPDILRVLSKATSERAADRYQSVEEFYLALQAATELTKVSERARPEATVNRKRPRLRIVVDIASRQSSADDTTVKKSWIPSLISSRALSSFIKNQSRAIYNRFLLWLHDCRLSLHNLRLNVASYLRTLPLKLLLHIALVVIICLTLLLALPPLVRRLYPTPATSP
jgi:serine/threonine protein kinase